MIGLAPQDRPREKLAEQGKAALGDNELLAVLLGHGAAGITALDLRKSAARRSRRLAGARARVAGGIVAATWGGPGHRQSTGGGGNRTRTPQRRPGGPGQAANRGGGGCRAIPFFTDSARPRWSRAACSCSTRDTGCCMPEVLTRGTADATPMHPRDVFREAALAAPRRSCCSTTIRRATRCRVRRTCS